MTQTSVKVGMVGAGYILKSHALAVAAIDGASLHAVADASRPRAADAVRRFGFTHAFGSVEEIADSDCDVVHVLVPPHLHVDFAEKLLIAGKSVFLEKPMGISSADCRRLGVLAEQRKLRLGVNHNFLFLPSYERLRSAVRKHELGQIDQITCNWNVFLPYLRSGPFDSWMMSAPANLFFEIGPHAAAFVLDLLREAEVTAAFASRPMELPTGQRVYRSWSALGENPSASFTLSMSVTQGQPDRMLRVRASGGSAQLDFGRDILWTERTRSANPIFDDYAVARGIVRDVGRIAGRDRWRRLLASLRKAPDNSAYGESILRSIERFYSAAPQEIDERHSWSFGAKVVEFCEQVCAAAAVGSPSLESISIELDTATLAVPAKILVVGATGFIGRRLVAKLVAKGLPVRVLSRSKSSAAVAFAGLPVDIHVGFHGDPNVARKAMEGIEVVYHLAKCDGQNWDDYVRGDIEPTGVLGEAAVAAGVERFIYTGTIDSYDSAEPGTRITAETPLDPKIRSRNLYARAKAACEDLLRQLSHGRGLPLIIMRPGIVVGAGADPAHIGVANFASASEVQYWGTGDNKLPLILVDDVADALVRGLEAPGAVGRTFLLTGASLLSAREYVAELGARSGVRLNARNRPSWQYWLFDLAKEGVKHLIRHPNRRSSTLHDWRCRSHRSTYDSRATREALDWQPVSDRDTLVDVGIGAAVAAASGHPAPTRRPEESTRKRAAAARRSR
ncbi:MAG: NAD-dependent epimerase/dehydratase family protein [Sphingomicrobium sp.]